MKPTPKGWPRLSVGLTYEEPIKAIDWLCAAFGFEVRLKVPDGNGGLAHSEITYGEAVMMLGGGKREWNASPKEMGGKNTQAIMIYVDDCDAHYAHAKKAGATIAMEPKTSDYGAEYWTDRTYEAVDLEGHHWWFVQRIK